MDYEKVVRIGATVLFVIGAFFLIVAYIIMDTNKNPETIGTTLDEIPEGQRQTFLNCLLIGILSFIIGSIMYGARSQCKKWEVKKRLNP